MQPIDNLVQNVIECYREHFSLILEDVRVLSKNKPLLVEGTALLPREVFGVLSKKSDAIWIVPAPEFQKEKYSQREWIFDILKQCDEPQKAFQNWMERDIKFADWIVNQVKKLNLDLLFVDGSKTIEENATIVAKHFQF